MITKGCNAESTCLICASEYHMELILLPYLKNNFKTKKIVVFTEKEIENTINTILEKINIKQETKEIFKKIDWSKDDEKKLKQLENYQNKNENIIVVINGMKKYIEKIKDKINKKNIEVVECLYLEDSELNMKEIKQNYRKILNTTLI